MSGIEYKQYKQGGFKALYRIEGGRLVPTAYGESVGLGKAEADTIEPQSLPVESHLDDVNWGATDLQLNNGDSLTSLVASLKKLEGLL